ncbi:MAG: hypothetical protein IJD39_08790 [Clostridia bacterium]|nr:hypothetical protein [Clostridia bacterium]
MGEINMDKCVLYDRFCIECGECDRCDLDPSKICDNCMQCVKGNDDYRGILIDEIENPEDSKGNHLH